MPAFGLRNRLRDASRFNEPAPRLALAFGLGVFLGVLPGTGALVAAALAAALRLNLPLMVGGALLNNPFTTPFVYAASFAVGRWLLGAEVGRGILSRFVFPALAGNLLLSVSLGLAGYAVVWCVVVWARARRVRSRGGERARA